MIEMNAPICMEMKVYAVEKETGKQAVLTMGLPVGVYPTRTTLEAIFQKAKDHLPDGFELMNKGQFFNAWLREEYGTTENFAVPGGSDFTDAVIEMEQDDASE